MDGLKRYQKGRTPPKKLTTLRNNGKLVIRGKEEDRGDFARKLKEYTDRENRKAEEKNDAEIESSPQLKALKEQYNEKLRTKEIKKRKNEGIS